MGRLPLAFNRHLFANTTIGYISGTSPTNTITFTSTTGDRDDVVLQRADDAVNQVAP